MGIDVRNCNVNNFGCLSTDKSSSIRTNSNPAGIATSTSINRCLFGPVDHAESMAFFQKEFARREEENKMKWNFDFANDKPMKGAFKWEKVDRSTSTTTCKILRTPSKVTKSRGKRSPLKSKVNNVVDVSVRTKQSSITDYLETKKNIVKQRASKK